MIRHMRHGSPPRLMALQSILSPNRRESLPTPSAGVRINGDVCRALMKFRAGWGEERMTPLSVEYCRRARGHLAAIGSPLAGGVMPTSEEASIPFSRQQAQVSPRRPERIEHRVAQARVPLPATRPGTQSGKPPSARPTLRPERVRMAALGAVKLSDAQMQALQRAREQE